MEPPERKRTSRTVREPFSIRLPGFILEEEIGLGDVVKRVTDAIGISPCSNCHRRGNTLNRWVVFNRGSR
jgi:hypothetical protein